MKNGPQQRAGRGRRTAGAHPGAEVVEPIDTTAAGDSFNAGYIAARLSGENPGAAAPPGTGSPAQKVRHRGAIMPRNAAAMH